MLMPVTPSVTTVTADTALGKFPVQIFSAEPVKRYAFAVSHSQFPPEVNLADTKQFFDKILQDYLKKGYQLLSSAEVTLHGIPGRQWEMEVKGQAIVTIRIYLEGHDSYQAYTVMPKTRPCQKHAREFVESFDLKQK